MSVWVFLKVFADACLYFSVIGALPSLFVHSFSFFLPAVLCGIGGAAAAMLYDRGSGKLRYLAILFPALVLVLVGSWMDLLILIPILLYCGMLIHRCDFALEYYFVREGFLRILGFWIPAFLMVAIFHGMEVNMGASVPVLNSVTPLCYGALYIAGNILLCSILRMGVENRSHRRSRIRTALTLAGAGVAVVGFVAAERALQRSASSLIDLLIKAIAVLMGLPVLMASRFIQWVLSLVETDYLEFVKENAENSEAMVQGPPLPTEEMAEELMQQQSPGFPWWLALLVLIGLGAMLLVLLRMFRARGTVTDSQEQREKLSAPEKEKKDSRRTNRGKVRHYYRKFLRAERKKGLKLRPDQTSEDILRSIAPDTDPQAAARLRELYLAARYDTKREISRQQAEDAREAMKNTQTVGK